MKILAITARSVTLELENTSPYFSPEAYTVAINGEPYGQESRNVFSLFSLKPNTSYRVSAGEEEVSFTTLDESFFMDVRAFRALGDGNHDDTQAFTAAIACLPEGGTLYVPQGTYYVKPLFLKSNMTLYLEKGAVLLGNPDRENYPVLSGILSHGDRELNLGTWQGEEVDCFASLITAVNCRNVAVIGEGSIDCNARAGDWYTNYREKRIAWRPRGGVFQPLLRCAAPGNPGTQYPFVEYSPLFLPGSKAAGSYFGERSLHAHHRRH